MQWLSKLTPRIVLAKQKKKEKIWWESKMANGKIMIVHFRWKLLINWKASQVSTFPISHFSAVLKFLFYGRRSRVWYTALNFINLPKKFPLYLYLFVCFFCICKHCIWTTVTRVLCILLEISFTSVSLLLSQCVIYHFFLHHNHYHLRCHNQCHGRHPDLSSVWQCYSITQKNMPQVFCRCKHLGSNSSSSWSLIVDCQYNFIVQCPSHHHQLASKDGLQDGAHQVVLNSNESLPSSIFSLSSTAPPASFTSTPSSSSLPASIQASTTPTSQTTPPVSPGWKVVSPKQRKAILTPPTTSSASSPPAPSPEKLAYTTFFDRRTGSHVFKCKKGEDFSTWVHSTCDLRWPNLHVLKCHDFEHHGGPNPGPKWSLFFHCS